MYKFFTFFVFAVLFTVPAMAGNLFPPANSTKTEGSTPTCPDKTALIWSTQDGGSLRCVDTSSMVSVSDCPSGKVLSGVSNGSPVCVTNGGSYGSAGGYSIRGVVCKVKNSYTGACSCPSGYAASTLLAGTDHIGYYVIYICDKH